MKVENLSRLRLIGQEIMLVPQTHPVSMLCHLGDEYDDIAELKDLYTELLQVPGIYDSRYKDGSLPAKLSE